MSCKAETEANKLKHTHRYNRELNILSKRDNILSINNTGGPKLNCVVKELLLRLFLLLSQINCVVLKLIVLFCVLFVCKCVLYCTTATGCQPNCS